MLFLPDMAIVKYNVIGVMSGTSLDGVDIVYVRFQLTKTWHFDIVAAETIPYTAEWHNTLKNLVSISNDDLLEIDKNTPFIYLKS